MLSTTLPQNASLLISEPFMPDLNFKRSVILLAEHSANGTLGFVLNHRSNLLIKDIIVDCPESNFPVFIGGPVANDTLHFIHNCYDRMNSGIEIKEGVYWGGNFETLKVLINNNTIQKDEIKFFIGYSGWGAKQLSIELGENSWIVSNKYKPEILFGQNEENLWKEVVIGLGPNFAHIANFPENPMMN